MRIRLNENKLTYKNFISTVCALCSEEYDDLVFQKDELIVATLNEIKLGLMHFYECESSRKG